MNIPTNHKVIEHNGEPIAVVVPYTDYLYAFENKEDEVTIPHAVAMAHTMDGQSLIRAWREYLGLTQEDAATRMNISQPAYRKRETSGAKLKMSVLMEIAQAFGIDVRQLYL